MMAADSSIYRKMGFDQNRGFLSVINFDIFFMKTEFLSLS